jgi:hypothetical protein
MADLCDLSDEKVMAMVNEADAAALQQLKDSMSDNQLTVEEFSNAFKAFVDGFPNGLQLRGSFNIYTEQNHAGEKIITSPEAHIEKFGSNTPSATGLGAALPHIRNSKCGAAI